MDLTFTEDGPKLVSDDKADGINNEPLLTGPPVVETDETFLDNESSKGAIDVGTDDLGIGSSAQTSDDTATEDTLGREVTDSCNSQDVGGASESKKGGEAGEIKPIAKSCIHRICSGQVVLTLATAVKELIENSIDAGATIIDIRLRNHGSELVEVSDNGSGVEESNLAALTLKHHTSKLRDFSDLNGVETFGFRGEALSSLCALSKLSVTTRHTSADVGVKLEYDHGGGIALRTASARTRGTTVTLAQLFSTLPVRRQEFQRNVSREFGHAVRVVTAYCLACTGVRISCTNQLDKGRKNLLVSSNGSDLLQENIASVYGAKQLQSLLVMTQCAPSDDVMREYGTLASSSRGGEARFRISGYISSCDHGKGRSSTDRQFFFVNKRPCDLQKVSRLVNEVYRSYNKHQSPFVILLIDSEKENVDVNVTPDKRTVFLLHEKLLLATIKSSLVKLFESRSSIYQVFSPGQGKSKDVSGTSLAMDCSSLLLMKSVDSPESCIKKALSPALSNLKRNFSSAFARTSNRASPDGTALRTGSPDAASKQRCLDSFVRKTPDERVSRSATTTHPEGGSASLNEPPLTEEFQHSDDVVARPSSVEDEPETRSKHSDRRDEADDFGERLETRTMHDDGDSLTLYDSAATCDDSEEPFGRAAISDEPSGSSRLDGMAGEIRSEVGSERSTDGEERCTDGSEDVEIIGEDGSDSNEIIVELDEPVAVERRQLVVPFSMARARRLARPGSKTKDESDAKFCRTFRAKISPGENGAAEEELSRSISKDMFAKMEILGQFNLGFIIVRLEDDLFIIDQHASDEKYNFEMLRKHTVIQNQKLIQPQPLGLTAVNEYTLIDNLSTFRTNGFEFEIDEDAAPTERVKLVSMPVSRNWTFGKEDVEELIFMLTDSPGVLCRPSRICQMFASRACRKSIMIGTALNRAQMRKLVSHLGDLDQPWNCPHGRPTMRHVINMKMVPD